MEGGLKSAEAYRATAMLCRQQAANDPDNSWRLLGEAERWEYLAEQILASRQKNRAAERATLKTGLSDVVPARPETLAAPCTQPSPSKPPRLG